MKPQYDCDGWHVVVPRAALQEVKIPCFCICCSSILAKEGGWYGAFVRYLCTKGRSTGLAQPGWVRTFSYGFRIKAKTSRHESSFSGRIMNSVKVNLFDCHATKCRVSVFSFWQLAFIHLLIWLLLCSFRIVCKYVILGQFVLSPRHCLLIYQLLSLLCTSRLTLFRTGVSENGPQNLIV